MKTLSRAAAGMLAGCALAICSPGISQSAPGFHWCPGQGWDPTWGSIYDWDWGQCHDWQRTAGQGGPMGNGPWGLPPSWAPPQPPPPPWAPGAQIMWNQTARSWGFWNNKIWTPI